MNSDEIEKFLDKKMTPTDNYVKITFKKRESFFGLFIKENDYTDLKAKNFWRIVPQSKLEEYHTSKNINLARIFCGIEFSRLTPYKESFN